MRNSKLVDKKKRGMPLKKYTIMIAGDSKSYLRQFHVKAIYVNVFMTLSFVLFAALSYQLLDYVQMRKLRASYTESVAENKALKNEAKALMLNLEQTKEVLVRVEDYTKRLDEIVRLKVKRVSKKTGIGPLSEEEENISKNYSGEDTTSRAETSLPLGVTIENLTFRPILTSINEVHDVASDQALNLQSLLSTLQKQSHLLSTIPMSKPVDGWFASGYGYRISPFTGKRTMHKGIDIAAPVGTPIYAPADGVVIFSGPKAGFGKFIMIAHGHGIVTRYGHNAQLMVSPGDKITRGSQIATVGMTGRTTGPHLHYEVWVNGRAINPNKFILSPNFAQL